MRTSGCWAPDTVQLHVHVAVLCLLAGLVTVTGNASGDILYECFLPQRHRKVFGTTQRPVALTSTFISTDSKTLLVHKHVCEALTLSSPLTATFIAIVG